MAVQSDQLRVPLAVLALAAIDSLNSLTRIGLTWSPGSDLMGWVFALFYISWTVPASASAPLFAASDTGSTAAPAARPAGPRPPPDPSYRESGPDGANLHLGEPEPVKA